MSRRHWIFALLSLLPGSGLVARLELAPLFRDSAVLQCDTPVPVWGHADPGAEVVARLLDQTATCTTDATGRWQLTFAPFKPGLRGDLVVRTSSEALERKNLLTGDVWLCAGQSNMQMHVRDADEAKAAVADAHFPDIRFFKVGIQTATTPAETVSGEWSACSPSTVGDLSAVAYYFSRTLHDRINRPIGLVVVAKGGTPIESWLSPSVLKTEPAARALVQHWEEHLSRLPTSFPVRPPFEPIEFSMSLVGAGGYGQPGVVYNGMLAPLIPYAVRGILWYQGETNTSRQFLQPAEYGVWFRRLITDWREHWGVELPFYFVQLPANNLPERDATGEQWATLREQQASALTLPKTAVAVTLDLGAPDNIHPPVKRPVGERLARIALKRSYQFNDVVDSGPVLHSVEVDGGVVRIRFQSEDDKLLTRDGASPMGFEFIATDGHSVAATLRVTGMTVVGELNEASPLRAIRYAWAQNPAAANLCNSSGLPARPFQIFPSDKAPVTPVSPAAH